MSRNEEWMMATLKFNDGVEFDTSGGLRVEKRRDGYYVVGKGMMCPVDSYEDGEKWIAHMVELTKTPSAAGPGDTSPE
jgi:hypothetical protein